MDLLHYTLVVDESSLIVAQESKLATHFRVLADVSDADVHDDCRCGGHGAGGTGVTAETVTGR